MKDNKKKEKLMRPYIYASLLLTAVLATAFTGSTTLEKPFLGRWRGPWNNGRCTRRQGK